MRLRTLTAAAACSLAALFTSMPSAQAADGDFTYVYNDASGASYIGFLADPPSGVCITLPEVDDDYLTAPAHSPRNHTMSTAVVFADVDCEGDYFSLRPAGGHASERLKLRSVVFS